MRAELRKATSIYSQVRCTLSPPSLTCRLTCAIPRQDKETIGWHVMQHEDDPTKFAIVERFMHKDSSQEEHLSNPYWKVSKRSVCRVSRLGLITVLRNSTRPSSRGWPSRSRSAATSNSKRLS